MEKAEARMMMRVLRNDLKEEERKVLQEKAMKQFLSVPEVQRAEWIYPFVSCRTEIDTRLLIQTLLDMDQYKIAVPRVNGADMEFVAIRSWEDLQPGTMGILEPEDGEIVAAENGIMLMPGLAFDRQGNRVGYGAGYYDRYLALHDNEKLLKIAYAFDFQVVDSIEAEAHDQKVNAIVTDRRIRCFLESPVDHGLSI